MVLECFFFIFDFSFELMPQLFNCVRLRKHDLAPFPLNLVSNEVLHIFPACNVENLFNVGQGLFDVVVF